MAHELRRQSVRVARRLPVLQQSGREDILQFDCAQGQQQWALPPKQYHTILRVLYYRQVKQIMHTLTTGLVLNLPNTPPLTRLLHEVLVQRNHTFVFVVVPFVILVTFFSGRDSIHSTSPDHRTATGLYSMYVYIGSSPQVLDTLCHHLCM